LHVTTTPFCTLHDSIANPCPLSQVGLIDPGAFKQIDELIQKELKGKGGRIETLSFAAVEGEATIE
jgi:hypothetical protein